MFPVPVPCPVCGASFVAGLRPWHERCPGCGFERARLTLDIEGGERPDIIDEDVREGALKPLRLEGFARLLDAVERRRPLAGLAVLDVGCAHGWFLDAAKARGARTAGVEPEAAIIARMSPGHDVRPGYFPGALAPGERFDALFFNDVFEHFPDPGACLDACRERLAPGGLLVLSLPNREGFFYRVGALLAALGLSGPFDRLWQAGFKSPHLSYFSPEDLSLLAEKHGFERIELLYLPSLRLSGLWERVRYDKSMPLWRAAVVWLGAAASLPLLALFPSDAFALLLRPRP
jgi:2-polyprenyl-3-methyl-5-hydroxy-6-metoxy-1,4-benzoquinol methylase